MGYYINPRNGSTKEQWLEKNGTPVPSPTWPPAPGMALVCLVDNFMFTAAGIAYSEAEFKEFRVFDGRERTWYSVDKNLLPAASDIPAGVL